jgi:arylsulfatase A-like enzyme
MLLGACGGGCAGAPGRPNIVVVVIDTLRADAVGWYDATRSVTPFLDDLVAAGGAVFWNAYANAPMTSPSVASLLTSRYVSQHGVATNGAGALPDEELTLPEILRQNGYATGGFTANFLMKPKRGFAQGFDRYQAFRRRPGIPKPRGNLVNRAAVAWVEKLREAASPVPPIFLYVQYIEPHIPHGAPPEDRKEAARRLEQPRTFPGPMAYAAEVFSVDARIRELFTALRERGVLDNAVVVVTADHGEQFFDHGGLYHANTLYNEEVRIPLAVFAGDQRERVDVHGVVELVDLAPTILELVGIRPPDAFEGDSFRGLLPIGAGGFWRTWLAGRRTAKRTAYLERNKPGAKPGEGDHRRALVVGSHKIIAHRDGRTEFYDLEADPGEKDPKGLKVEQRAPLLAEMEAARRRAGRGISPPRVVELDADAVESLRALGYAE